MTNLTHYLQYGTTTITYEVSYTPRKTLAIEVHPDLRVTIQAPEAANLTEIEAKVRKRAAWILRQQRRFETYLPHLPLRQYLSGETHRYLGRQYRLKIDEIEAGDGPSHRDGQPKPGVKLSRGYFYIQVSDKTNTDQVKKLLTEWYRVQARRVFKAQLDICFAKGRSHWERRFLDLPYPDLTIRQMKSRWGSCTPDGKILLNLKLIQVPKMYIDYVIMHELCHLKEHNHTRQFYDLLDRVMPNWRDLREKLNTMEVS